MDDFNQTGARHIGSPPKITEGSIKTLNRVIFSTIHELFLQLSDLFLSQTKHLLLSAHSLRLNTIFLKIEQMCQTRLQLLLREMCERLKVEINQLRT